MRSNPRIVMNSINVFSIVLSTLTPLLLAMVFYRKQFFEKSAVDISHRGKFNKGVFIGVALIASFLISFFLLNFNNDGINQEGQYDTFQHGAWHGGFVAVTIVIPVILIHGILSIKHWKNILTDIAFWLISLILMGGIVDVMNHWQNIPMPEGY